MMAEIRGVSENFLHVPICEDHITRELICTSGETKTRRHDRNEIAFRDSAGLEHFNHLRFLHHLHFLSWMIYKIPIYCALIYFWFLVFDSIQFSFEGWWGCTILYIIHLQLVGKDPLYHITSRLGRSLVGFLPPVPTLGADWHGLSVCGTLKDWIPNWAHVYIYLRAGRLVEGRIEGLWRGGKESKEGRKTKEGVHEI